MRNSAPMAPWRAPARHRSGLLALWLLALPCLAQEPDWHDYASLLAAHVSSGARFGVSLQVVDYRGVAADPHYPAALAALAQFDTATLGDARERLAFYINTYNLLTLKMVIEHQPLASIKDAGNLLWPVWKRTAGTLGGEAVSLDDIEHRRLRTLREPRVHFAIVCASVSCPDLRAEPYRAAQLDAQLDDQVRGFLANPGKGSSVTGKRLRVSKIFDWFETDFADAGGVQPFIARYRNLPADVELSTDLPYDWRLNGR